MEQAEPGDRLTRDDLQQARQWLIDQANALNKDLAAALDVSMMGRISDRQTELTNMAGRLNIASIDLAIDEAKISAEHINSAIAHAKEVIDRVAKVKAKLKLIGSVLDFFAAVLTGSGTKIFDGAVKLASDLKAAEQP